MVLPKLLYATLIKKQKLSDKLNISQTCQNLESLNDSSSVMLERSPVTETPESVNSALWTNPNFFTLLRRLPLETRDALRYPLKLLSLPLNVLS
jgi:hypothetical protein